MRKAKIIEYRRAKVGELLAFGKSQNEIANLLGTSQPVISRDIAFLEAGAREKLADHVRKAVPHTHLICMRGLNEIIKRCWAIADNAKNDYLKIHALTLLNAVYAQKQLLSTDGTMLSQSLDLIEKSRGRVTALEKGKIRPLQKLLNGEEEAKEVVIDNEGQTTNDDNDGATDSDEPVDDSGVSDSPQQEDQQ